MTICFANREFIATDSRLSFEPGSAKPLTVGKIFKRKGGGIFTTAGDCRRTSHLERALSRGCRPDPLEVLEGEDSDGLLLMPGGELIFFDTDFGSFPVGDEYVVIGAPVAVVESWLLHGADPITAIKRAIEVDPSCGYPIQVAYPDGRFELVDEDGTVTSGPLPTRARR